MTHKLKAWAVRFETGLMGVWYIDPHLKLSPLQAGCTTALFATRREARQAAASVRREWNPTSVAVRVEIIVREIK